MRPRRALRSCEAAITEVLGYVLMLFLSTAVLVLSLQAFLDSREQSQNLLAATELRIVSDRIAQEVLQASVVAVDLPNGTYAATIKLPELGGRAFYVNASHGKVYANTTDGVISANITAFEVEALNLQLLGTVYGAQGYARVTYEKWPSGWRTINITI